MRTITFDVFVAEETPTEEKIHVIRRGVGARVIDQMVRYLDVPKNVVFTVLHTPESTAHRLIRDNRPLDSAASERVVRVADVLRMAEDIFGGREAATRWLKTPNLALGDATPLSMLDTEPGATEVRRILSSIDYGGAFQVADDIVWRIARRPHALDRTGVGARDHGGRWNRPGTAAIYASGTVGIAALEKFVHLAGVLPSDLVLVRIKLPDNRSVEEPPLADLPTDWNAVPIRPGSMDFGTTWIREGRSLVLYVPSALVPEERNAALNPNHPEFADVQMFIQRDFHYDPRMYLARTV